MSVTREREASNPRAEKVVTATQARQGVTGHNVRYVLIVSVTAVVIAFALIGYYFFGL